MEGCIDDERKDGPYMIETYKILGLTGKYDIETAPSLVGVCSSVTRGHSLRLQKEDKI